MLSGIVYGILLEFYDPSRQIYFLVALARIRQIRYVLGIRLTKIVYRYQYLLFFFKVFQKSFITLHQWNIFIITESVFNYRKIYLSWRNKFQHCCIIKICAFIDISKTSFSFCICKYVIWGVSLQIYLWHVENRY